MLSDGCCRSSHHPTRPWRVENDGSRTSPKTNPRQVLLYRHCIHLIVTYFLNTIVESDLGLLRAKMTELGNEMLKLNKGIEKNNKEVQSLPLLEKKVKDMAMEITG